MSKHRMSRQTKPLKSTVPNIKKPNSLPKSPVMRNKRINLKISPGK